MMRTQQYRREPLIFLLGLLGMVGFVAQVSAIQLRAVNYNKLPGNKLEIYLQLDKSAPQLQTFSTQKPPRIVLDLPNTTSALSHKSVPIASNLARSVSVLVTKQRMRVVINLLKPTGYRIDVQGNKISILLGAGVKASTRYQPQPYAPPAANKIRKIDFKRGLQGEGRVQIHMTDRRARINIRQSGKRVLVDMLDTHLPVNLHTRLDVTDFATPVRSINPQILAEDVRLNIGAAGDFALMAYLVNDVYTIEFRPLNRTDQATRPAGKKNYTGDPLSLNFQDIPVRSVLQLLADFTALNMVVSDTVSGNITLRLKNVPWDQAMDIILKTKGLSMRRDNNVILIAPAEELAAREKLELEAQIQIAELAPLRAELIQVKYAKASDLSALLKSAENRLLSERGNVTIDERTNTLLIQDTPAKLLEIRDLVDKLDIPIRQVLIESRIVIANNDFARDLGVRLGADYFHTGTTARAGIGGGLPGDIAWDASVGQTTIQNPANSGNQALLVNLPQTLAAGTGGAINFVLGKVGQHLLRLELSAMQQEGKGEIISSPRIITSDQNKAIIKQGVEIPYQEATSNGATSVAFKEAVLQLEVVPHITPDDRVIMDLQVNKDNPDFTRAVLGVPPVDTRELKTSVLVDNGETIVLGGVFERTRAQRTAKVPLLGDLPLLGALFRQEQIQDENNELLIFVTPRILDTGQSLQAASRRRLDPLK